MNNNPVELDNGNWRKELRKMHDSLCRQNYQPYEDDSRCPDCELIAAAYKRGYEDALEDNKE